MRPVSAPIIRTGDARRGGRRDDPCDSESRAPARARGRRRLTGERGGRTVATAHEALVGIRDRFAMDVAGGEDMKAHGNIVEHEYEIKRGDDVVASISKKWFRVRDTYGVEVAAGEDDALVLALT